MAQVVTFEPAILRIVEVDTGGDNSIEIREMYSEWKDWVRADFGVRGAYPRAFAVIGGEPSGDGQVGSTFFLMGGWKFRPAEHSHVVALVGNLWTDPDKPQERPWVPTLGSYTVGVSYQQSNLVDTVVTGSGVLPADVTAIGAEVEGRILSDGQPFDGAAVTEMHRLQGYDAANPATLHRDAQGKVTQIDAGTGHVVDVDENGTDVTFTRQP